MGPTATPICMLAWPAIVPLRQATNICPKVRGTPSASGIRLSSGLWYMLTSKEE